MTQETAIISYTSIFSLEETDEIKKYRYFWWKTGNIHPKARWEEANKNFTCIRKKAFQLELNLQE
ncbi:14760_t:CDS:2 [Acaulospora morrowiae]|uniref:14760_t:CDS:1 n=1 Tax=Acaulospora morrowiae TaxID=94023 RepID=A0A9N9ATY5_9GLOM|nr:14760_t:CDS:2 [Acaulospora morrowiae]